MTNEEKKWLLSVAECAKAMAEGKEIEFSNDDEWTTKENIGFYPNVQYRIKPTPEYVPFENKDWEKFMGKTIVSKQTGFKSIITGCDIYRIYFSGGFIYYSELFKWYTFKDGTPCGKLKE